MQFPEHIRSLSPKLAFIERIEPIVCSWRVQSGLLSLVAKRTVNTRARELTRNLRDMAWKLMPMERPRPGQVVILAHAATPSTIGTVLPVMRHLAEDGRPAFLVTNAKTRKYLGLKLHSGHADVRQIAAYSGALCQRETVIRAREIADMLAEFFPGEDTASWLKVGLAMRSATESWIGNAKVIVTDSDAEAYRKGFVLGAANAGVPAIILQQGLWGQNHFPIHAAKAFCWGPHFCAEAERCGVDPGTLEAIGCPRFDHLPSIRTAPKSPSLYHAMGKQSGRPLVLIVSNAHAQPLYRQFFDCYFKTVEALAMSKCDLVVKLHPAEPGLTAYREHLSPAAFNRLRILPSSVGLEQAIVHSDVIFQGFSTAAVEAMLLGLPVLFEEGDPTLPKICDFPDYGGGVWCTGSQAAEACMALACDGAERRRVMDSQAAFLERAVVNQGCATAAVCKRLEGVETPARYVLAH